ncbi:MAG: hypothetical protein JNK87_00465, partial [Bryobacterales bacterium]|nr:hypothetical protein [Bryobacterales bacterium]
ECDETQDSICRAVPIDLGPPDSRTILELHATGVRGRSSLEAVTCTIGGEIAPVLLAGPDSTSSGLDQVQVVIPHGLRGRGPAAIRLSVDAVEANPTQVIFR